MIMVIRDERTNEKSINMKVDKLYFRKDLQKLVNDEFESISKKYNIDFHKIMRDLKLLDDLRNDIIVASLELANSYNDFCESMIKLGISNNVKIDVDIEKIILLKKSNAIVTEYATKHLFNALLMIEKDDIINKGVESLCSIMKNQM